MNCIQLKERQKTPFMKLSEKKQLGDDMRDLVIITENEIRNDLLEGRRKFT